MGGKQIEVRRLKSPYTNVQNRLIWDENLRPQTKWLLIAMLSLPEDWDYSIRGLAAKTGLAKETISKMLGELETAGYLRRKPQTHDEGGRFAGAEYILTDVPGEFGEPETPPDGSEPPPCPSLPCTVEPCTVNSPQQNNIQQTKDIIPPIVPHEGDRPPTSDELFERFWKAYPYKKAKEKARRAWKRLKPDLPLCRVMAAALELDKKSEAWTKEKGRFIPYPATWLNGRRWEDEHTAPEPQQSTPLRGEGVTYD